MHPNEVDNHELNKTLFLLGAVIQNALIPPKGTLQKYHAITAQINRRKVEDDENI
jgi:hypothetical protein